MPSHRLSPPEVSAPKLPLILLLAILAAACGSAQPGGTGGTPRPSPVATSQAELKYSVIAVAGVPFSCGPPVASDQFEGDTAAAQFPTIKADTATYAAIIAHEHPSGQESSVEYQVSVWRQWRELQAIQLSPSAGGYAFSFQTIDHAVTGTVSQAGAVNVTARVPARKLCPICLRAGALIDTPGGPVRVADLGVGAAVWTAATDGSRIPGVVKAVGSVAFPAGHDAIELHLSDGRSITASPGHPTADGRTLGQLRVGDRYDGATVGSAHPVHLADGGTYDLLPSGPTGQYWADGIRLGSTLFAHS